MDSVCCQWVVDSVWWECVEWVLDECIRCGGSGFRVLNGCCMGGCSVLCVGCMLAVDWVC